MNTIERILLQKKMIDEGIVPYDDTNFNRNFGKVLEQLSPEDARRSKRKFRKIWRSIMQDKMRKIATNYVEDSLMKFGKERMLQIPLGISNCVPNKRNKLNRKVFVLKELKKNNKQACDEVRKVLEST
jgi:hypothetical protein